MPDHVSTPEETHVERFGNRGNSLLLSFFPALLVGGAMARACGNSARAWHPRRTRDAHDHLVAGARLREFRDERVAATRTINVIAPRERLEHDVSDKEFHRGL